MTNAVTFEYTQTEVKRFFSRLSILFYMKNKIIKYIKFCCCSVKSPLHLAQFWIVAMIIMVRFSSRLDLSN